MAEIGYARASTEDQSLEVQLDQLQGAGCSKIYQEKASGAEVNRPQLAALLDYVREGDRVTACKLDRVARSTRHLLQIVDALESKGVAFRVLNIHLDTATPTGRLMLTMLAAIATFERELMLERQREGIKVAKSKGKYTGRKPTARAKAARIMELIEAGNSRAAVAEELKIGVASVYRVIREAKAAGTTKA